MTTHLDRGARAEFAGCVPASRKTGTGPVKNRVYRGPNSIAPRTYCSIGRVEGEEADAGNIVAGGHRVVSETPQNGAAEEADGEKSQRELAA